MREELQEFSRGSKEHHLLPSLSTVITWAGAQTRHSSQPAKAFRMCTEPQNHLSVHQWTAPWLVPRTPHGPHSSGSWHSSPSILLLACSAIASSWLPNAARVCLAPGTLHSSHPLWGQLPPQVGWSLGPPTDHVHCSYSSKQPNEMALARLDPGTRRS